MPVTPLLIHQDTAQQDDLSLLYANLKTATQSIVSMYGTLGIAALTPTDFPRLFNNVDELIFDKLTGGQPVIIGDLKLNKTKAMEILEKPRRYDVLIAAIEQFKAEAKAGFTGNIARLSINVAQIDSYFTLDANKVVQYTQRVTDEIAAAGQNHTRTDAGAAVFNFVEDIVAAYYNRGLKQHFGRPDAIFEIVKETIDRLDLNTNSYVLKYKSLIARWG